MRIWSIHPNLLDTKGLVAVWRETLLAKHVLEGKTRGYKNHPQLIRFRTHTDPLGMINGYLSEIFWEAERRGYAFKKEKIDWTFSRGEILLHRGQLAYEWQHFLKKTAIRDPQHFNEVKNKIVKAHPVFRLVDGSIEHWERTDGNSR